MFDAHIHLKTNTVNKSGFKEKSRDIGITGAIVLSLPPDTFFMSRSKFSFTERLDNVLEWGKTEKDIYPFLWVDPMDDNVSEQIGTACKKGISGFKIICDRFYPSDEKAMEIFRYIAGMGKPILFHSGILWDGKVSSKYNRPLEFECLLEVPKLKFALAHISWPWCDELIALYGKFLNSLVLRPETSAEMFIDTTPGTPPIYREEALKKLYTVGYDIENNIIFGTDSYADDYNSNWVSEWISRDKDILKKTGINAKQIEKYFSANIKRFLGIDNLPIEKKTLIAGSN